MDRMLAAVATEGIVKVLDSVVSYLFHIDEEDLFYCTEPEVPFFGMDFASISCIEDSQNTDGYTKKSVSTSTVDGDTKKSVSTSTVDKNRPLRGRSSSLVCSFIRFESDEFDSDKEKAGRYSSSPVSSFIRFENDTLDTIRDECEKVIRNRNGGIEEHQPNFPVTSFMWDKTITLSNGEDFDTGYDTRRLWSQSIVTGNTTPSSYSSRDELEINEETFALKDDIRRHIYSDGETASSSAESAHEIHRPQEDLLETAVARGGRRRQRCLENCVNLNDSFFLRRNSIRKKLMK